MILKRFRSKFLVNATHFKALVKRNFALIFSDKVSLTMLLLQAPLMVLTINFACPKDFSNYFRCQTTLFILSAVCVFMATLNSYREINKERDILIRETNAGLDSSAYVLSKVVVQGVICFFQALVLILGTALHIDYNLTRPLEYVHFFFFTFLVFLSSTCIGLFISAVLKNSDSAILPVLFLIITQVVFSESVFPLPEKLTFLSYFVVTRWALGGYGHIFNFERFKMPGIQVNFSRAFNTSYLTSVLVLIGICILMLTLTILSVRNLRKKKF